MSTSTTMTDRRLPALTLPPHVIVMLSAATAGYSVALAGVASLQAAHEGALMDERSPSVAGVERLANGHDDLGARLDAAGYAYADAADAYTRSAAILASVDRDLAELAARVAEIDGVSRSLPTSVRVPVVRTVVQAKAPATHATTGASGG